MAEEATQDEPMVTNYCRMCEAAAKRIEALEAALRRIEKHECKTDWFGAICAMQRIAHQALGETQ